MPIPLTPLDTRRWDDLVEEVLALLPRHARSWTDHNLHDPGITFAELASAVVEQEIFRVDRIPVRHRKKFLRLLGFEARPPQASRAVLSMRTEEGVATVQLPAGVLLGASTPTGSAVLQTLDPVTVSPASLEAVLADGGGAVRDLTASWRRGEPLLPWGDDPSAGEDATRAIVLGFDRSLPVGAPVDLWLDVEPEAIRPTDVRPGAAHGHSVAWEFGGAGGWRVLDPERDEVMDGTRGLTRRGFVRIRLPEPMQSVSLGSGEHHALRCRLVEGRPDAVPHLRRVAAGAVEVAVRSPSRGTFETAAGVSVPPVGTMGVLLPEHDGVRITSLAASGDGPELAVLAVLPGTQGPRVTLDAVVLGRATGEANQCLSVPLAPVTDAELELWSVLGGHAERWSLRPDLDASRPGDRHAVLDAMTGDVRFGDGLHGRVPPAGSTLLARYRTNGVSDPRLVDGAEARLAGVDDAWNRRVLGTDPQLVDSQLASIGVVVPPHGARPEETLAALSGRAAQELWAHERLLELAESDTPEDSLDGLEPERVFARPAPRRAVTAPDIERIALDVPGTSVTRARALVNVHPDLPCLAAAGIVTVVVLPSLPMGRPEPTAGLLGVVQRHLDERRVVGTRILVVGPTYAPVRIAVRLAVRRGANAVRTAEEVRASLAAFLHPLHGGPLGRGWPFGRDVHRTEILEHVARVPGVDHVVRLEMERSDRGGDGCGDVCLGPVELVDAPADQIEVTFA